MKKTKLNLMVFALFLTNTILLSQSTINDDVAHRRYWYYRARFINDFTKMGINQGECIVLAERNQGITNGVYDNTAKVGPDQIDLSNMYLASLALEYKLLTRNNQNTDETIKEIYQLLYTLNRLDLGADKVWDAYATHNPVHALYLGVMAPNTNTSDMNGYMMREDMYHDFISNNFSHFNYDVTESGCTGNGGFTGLPNLSVLDQDSKFQHYVNSPFGTTFSGQTTIPIAAEVSLVHDKYYSMLAAFMFIVKYIPPGKNYYENGIAQTFQDGTSGIQEQAIAITNRLFPYIKGNTFPHATQDEWILRQGDGSTIGYTAGAFMSNYSFSTSRAVCNINTGYPWPVSNTCSSYLDQTAQTIGLAAYISLGGAQPTQDLAVFTAWNQAFSNFPISVFPCWFGMSANTTSGNLRWAELVREVLFQTHPIYTSISSIETPISNAPCEGPWNQSSNSYWAYYANQDWSAQDRTEHPNAMGATTGIFAGNYPGVDYMFLHNLFYEYLNQKNMSGKYDKAINFMDNLDEQTWPMYSTVTSGLLGTTSSPANIHVFQNLTSRAQINSYIASQVDYRAGKEIALLPENGTTPGFSLQEGSEFAAYIQRYLCSVSDYGSGLRAAQTTPTYDYEADQMNTTVRTHSVSYPPSSSDLYPDPVQEDFPNAQNVSAKAQEEMVKKFSGENKRFEVEPNPNNGAFKIIANKVEENETLSLIIIDMKGTIIYEEANFITGEFDFTNYDTGIYMARLKSSLGYTSSKKINISR